MRELSADHRLLHERPNIAYLCAGHHTAWEDAARGMVVLSDLLNHERLSGMVIDFRTVSHLFDDLEYAELAKRARLFSPTYFPVGWITGPCHADKAELMVRLLRQHGLNSRSFTSWATLTAWLGCPQAMDPLPRETLEV